MAQPLPSRTGTLALPRVFAPPRNFINKVVNADCLTFLPQLPCRSIDFVLTDPPYLAHYLDRTGRSVENDDRDPWLVPAFAEIFRVLKPGRFCVSFYGWPKADKFLAAWKAAGFRPVGHLVWVKRYASATRFLAYCHEQAYLLAKGNPVRPAKPIRDVLPWHYTGQPSARDPKAGTVAQATDRIFHRHR